MMIVIAIVVIAMLVKMFKFKLRLKFKNDDSVKEDDGDEKRNAVLRVCISTNHN